MKFLIDAQLPRRIVNWFAGVGSDAQHTLDLPEGNRTTDEKIIEFADQGQRAVVTKDADFVNSHLVDAKPAKLLLVSTGNISNRELEQLMTPVIPDIVREFQGNNFLELGAVGANRTRIVWRPTPMITADRQEILRLRGLDDVTAIARGVAPGYRMSPLWGLRRKPNAFAVPVQ